MTSVDIMYEHWLGWQTCLTVQDVKDGTSGIRYIEMYCLPCLCKYITIAQITAMLYVSASAMFPKIHACEFPCEFCYKEGIFNLGL